MVFHPANGLYYDFEGLGCLRSKRSSDGSQARGVGEVIPEVQPFDFASYPKIMTLQGITEAT